MGGSAFRGGRNSQQGEGCEEEIRRRVAREVLRFLSRDSARSDPFSGLGFDGAAYLRRRHCVCGLLKLSSSAGLPRRASDEVFLRLGVPQAITRRYNVGRARIVFAWAVAAKARMQP